jgi:hypothetical protein
MIPNFWAVGRLSDENHKGGEPYDIDSAHGPISFDFQGVGWLLDSDGITHPPILRYFQFLSLDDSTR